MKLPQQLLPICERSPPAQALGNESPSRLKLHHGLHHNDFPQGGGGPSIPPPLPHPTAFSCFPESWGYRNPRSCPGAVSLHVGERLGYSSSGPCGVEEREMGWRSARRGSWSQECCQFGECDQAQFWGSEKDPSCPGSADYYPLVSCEIHCVGRDLHFKKENWNRK